MFKNIANALFAGSMLFAAGILSAQTIKQSTRIVKQSFDNPTIAVANFEGTGEQRQKLEELLLRSGWLRVLPQSQAAKAQIKVNAKVSNGSVNAVVSFNGKEVPVATASNADTNLLMLQATDNILNKLFGLPPMCTRKIAFVRHNSNNVKELYACFLDGSGQERLTFNNTISTEPSWGNANALVYTAAQNNALSIILMDYAHHRQKVISHARGLNASAALSPDGRTVALAMSDNKTVDLFTIDLATGKRTRLTKDKAVESSPCWSPDGKQICFVSDAIAIGAPRLYIVPADGSSPAKRLQTGGGEAVSPDWSRRGNKICFATKNSYGKYAIAIMDMDAPGKQEIVTAADGDWEAPSWAPDGRHVICTRAVKNARDIVVVDTVKGTFRPITKGAVLSLPTWQPAF